MSGIFSSDNKFMKGLSKFFDLLVLNLLFLITCIPVFTIGASLCGLYYAIVKSVRRDHGDVAKEYFRSFKDNFIPGTISWLLFLIVGFFLSFGVYMTATTVKSPLGAVLLALYFAAFIFLLGIAVYVYPVLSRFTVSVKDLFQMSLIMSVKHMKKTALLDLIAAAMILLLGIGWSMMPILLFFTPCAMVFLLSLVMENILVQYTPDENHLDVENEEELTEEELQERKAWYLQGGKGKEAHHE